MNAPRPIEVSTSTIANLARSVSRQVGYQPGGDLHEVVEKLGGTIVHEDTSGASMSDSGSISIKGGSFVIRLALATGPLRDRFTIAHELGHFVLHYLYRRQFMGETELTELVAQRYGTSLAEREANQFAAAFLMPAEEFKVAYVENDGNHSVLSMIFGVSRAASEVRAQALGLE